MRRFMRWVAVFLGIVLLAGLWSPQPQGDSQFEGYKGWVGNRFGVFKYCELRYGMELDPKRFVYMPYDELKWFPMGIYGTLVGTILVVVLVIASVRGGVVRNEPREETTAV